MPSRAASVQIRMRSGSFAGSALKARFTSSRRSVPGGASEDADALVARSVSASASRSRRSSQRRVSSYSVKMISRRSFQLAARADCALIHSTSQCTRASGRVQRCARRWRASRRPWPALLADRRRWRPAAPASSPPRPRLPRPRRSPASAPSSSRPRSSSLVRRAAVDEGLRARPRRGACSLSISRCKRLPVDPQCLGEGRDRREQTLLEPDEGELRKRRPCARGSCADALSCAARHIAQAGARDRAPAHRSAEPESRSARPYARESFAETPKIALEAADHHRLEVLRPHLDAAREPLRVEHFQQRRKAVGVAVVRRRGEEQTMLEPLGKLAHGLRELTRDRVAGAARRRRVMRLVEDQQRARPEFAEDVAQAGDVVSSVSRLWEMMKREPVRQGLTEKPRSRRSSPMRSRSMMSNDRPNLLSSSSFHWIVMDGGAATTMNRCGAAAAARARSGPPRSSCRGRHRRRSAD